MSGRVLIPVGALTVLSYLFLMTGYHFHAIVNSLIIISLCILQAGLRK